MGKGPTGVIKSILDTSRVDGKGRDEIFVDIVEKLACTFNSSGQIQTSQIDGAIQVTHIRVSSTFPLPLAWPRDSMIGSEVLAQAWHLFPKQCQEPVLPQKYDFKAERSTYICLRGLEMEPGAVLVLGLRKVQSSAGCGVGQELPGWQSRDCCCIE